MVDSSSLVAIAYEDWWRSPCATAGSGPPHFRQSWTS